MRSSAGDVLALDRLVGARACVLCPKTDRRDENGHVADLIRNPQLISLNNFTLEHLYPHLIPHPRACSSSVANCAASNPAARPTRRTSGNRNGRLGPGPPTLIFPCDFFWSAENVGTGCDHCADWADQASVSSGVSSSSGRTFHRVWVCRLTREAQSQSRLAWALSSTSQTGPCKAD